MAQKTKKNSKKSFKEIALFKKKIDITFEGEVLFTIEELTGEKFKEFMQIILDQTPDIEDDIENAIINYNQTNVIAFLIKNTITGEYADFKDINDEDLVDIINEMSEEIVEQINDAFDKLIMKKVSKRINDMQELTKTFDALMNKVGEEAIKLEKTNKLD